MRYDHTTFDNGLEIVGEWQPEALSMACGFFCRTGSRDEQGPESGVSHFLEHMMFKGTDTLSYDDINKTFDRIGANYNAFTSEENTVYYGQVLPEFQHDLFDLLGRMMRPALRDEDFDMEKNVILEEIAMYDDRPLWVAHDRCRTLFYNGHPLANSVLGTKQSISDLARDQMHDYFSRRYAADNLVVGLSGRYDWDAAVAQVRDLTDGWQASRAGRERNAVSPGGGVQTVRMDKFNQAHLYVLAPGIAAQDPRRLAAGVTGMALGAGQSSRLHWALVDPGLAETAGLSHDEEDHAGAFAGYIVCEPEDAQKVLDVYRETLTAAQDEGLEQGEVTRATRRLGSSLVLSGESPLNRLVNVGFDWIYRGAVTPLDALVELVRNVTVDDCNALLAERPFDDLAVVCVGPVDELS